MLIDEVEEILAGSNLSIIEIIIISLVLIGLIILGCGIFNQLKRPQIANLGLVFFGTSLIVIGAFIAYLYGIIPL